MDKNSIKDSTTLVWILSGLALVGYIIYLFVYKKNHPEFDMLAVFTRIAIGAVLMAAVGGGFYYFSRKLDLSPSKSEKMSPAITFAQCRELAKLALKDPMYMDEIDMSQIEDEGMASIGKPPSQVYRLICYGKHTQAQKYVIGINAHYPETMKRILVNPKDYQVTKMFHDLAFFPEEEAPTRVTQVKNLSTGTEVVTSEPVMQEEKKKEESKDALDKS